MIDRVPSDVFEKVIFEMEELESGAELTVSGPFQSDRGRNDGEIEIAFLPGWCPLPGRMPTSQHTARRSGPVYRGSLYRDEPEKLRAMVHGSCIGKAPQGGSADRRTGNRRGNAQTDYPL